MNLNVLYGDENQKNEGLRTPGERESNLILNSVIPTLS